MSAAGVTLLDDKTIVARAAPTAVILLAVFIGCRTQVTWPDTEEDAISVLNSGLNSKDPRVCEAQLLRLANDSAGIEFVKNFCWRRR